VVILGASTSSDGVVGVGSGGGVFDHPAAWANRLAHEHAYEVRRLGFDRTSGRVASGSSLFDWLPTGCLLDPAAEHQLRGADVLLWTPFNNTAMGSTRCTAPAFVEFVAPPTGEEFEKLLRLHVAQLRTLTEAPIVLLTDPEVPASCPTFLGDPCMGAASVAELYESARTLCNEDISVVCPEAQPLDLVVRPDHFDTDPIHPNAEGHAAFLAAALDALEEVGL